MVQQQFRNFDITLINRSQKSQRVREAVSTRGGDKRLGINENLFKLGYEWYVLREGMIIFYHVGMWKEMGEMFRRKMIAYVSNPYELLMVERSR